MGKNSETAFECTHIHAQKFAGFQRLVRWRGVKNINNNDQACVVPGRYQIAMGKNVSAAAVVERMTSDLAIAIETIEHRWMGFQACETCFSSFFKKSSSHCWSTSCYVLRISVHAIFCWSLCILFTLEQFSVANQLWQSASTLLFLLPFIPLFSFALTSVNALNLFFDVLLNTLYVLYCIVLSCCV